MNAFILATEIPSLSELLVILVIIMLLFGGKKIPEMMKGLGQGVSEFKKAMREGDQHADDDKKDSKTQKE